MNRAAIGPPIIVLWFGQALWAGVAAQALTPHRAGLACGPINRAYGRAGAVLFSVVLRAAHRGWPIWSFIASVLPPRCSIVPTVHLLYLFVCLSSYPG